MLEREGKMKADEIGAATRKKREDEVSATRTIRFIDALWYTQCWWFRSVDENSKKDVTLILKSRADGKAHFEMSPGEFNSVFGNIAQGFKKYLRVDYAYADVNSTVTIDSDQPLVLASPRRDSQ